MNTPHLPLLALLCLSLACSPTDELGEAGADTSTMDESSDTGACTPGLLDCPCVQGTCVEGLSCVEDLCEMPSCGNGLLEHFEACDDGNSDNSDACTDSCMLAACGDGHLQAGESCDDGNPFYGDACNSLCSGNGLAWIHSHEIAALGRERLDDLTSDAAGHIFGAGTLDKPNGDNLRQGLVLAFDANGELLWQQVSSSVDPTGYRSFSSISLDSAGNLYAVGTEQSQEGPDVPLIVEYDPDGNLLWEQTLDELAGHNIVDALIDSDDRLVVVGGDYDGFASAGFLRSYASDHSLLSMHDYQSALTEIVALPDADFAVLHIAGSANSIGRLDAAGAFVWSEPLPGFVEHTWSGLVADASGGMIAVGGRPGNLGPLPAIAAYDLEGNLRWMIENLAPSVSSYASDVALAQDGTAYVAGYADGAGYAEVPLLRALSSTGEPLWSDYQPSGAAGELTALTVDAEGMLIGASFTPPVWEVFESNVVLFKYVI